MPGPGGISNVGLGIQFSAQDLASGPISLIARNFGNLRQSFARGLPRIMAGIGVLAGGIASISAGVGIFRRAWSFAVEAGEFDTEMARVRTISRATVTEFDALGNAAIEAGIRTQFAPLEAAQGLRTLSQQGLNARQSVEALVPVLDFAAAGNIQVAEAAEVAQGVLNAYGMTVDNLTSVTDRLMRGTQLSALSANEFITVMGRAASSGRIFGTNLDDVIIALGSLRSAGIPATVATTALTEAMRRLATDSGAREELRRYNVAIEDSQGNLRSVIDITRDFSQAISHLTEAQQAQIVNHAFGVRGMREFNAIANIMATRTLPNGTQQLLRGNEAIRYYREQLNQSSGTTEEFRRARLSTFEGQLVLLTGTLQTFSTVIGRTFGPIFRPIVLGFTEIVNRFTQAWLAIPESIRSFIGILGLSGGAFAIVSGVILTVVGAIVLLISFAGELLLIIAGVAAGIIAAMAPVIAIGAALAGMAVMVYRAWQRDFGGLRTWTERWALRIRLIFLALRDIFTTGEISRGVWGALISRESRSLREGLQSVNTFVNRVRLAWANFVARFREKWAELRPTFVFFREQVDELGRTLGTTFGTFARGTERLTGEGFESLGRTIADVVVGAFRMLITMSALMIMVLTRVIAVMTDPTFVAFAGIIGTIVGGIVRLASILSTVYNWLSRIARVLAPVSWLFTGRARAGETTRALAPGALTGIRALVSPMPAGETARAIAPRLLGEREYRPTATEAGTAMPSAARTERALTEEGFNQLIDRLGRAEARTEVRLENTLRLEERVLEQSIDDILLRREVFGGEMVTQTIQTGD